MKITIPATSFSTAISIITIFLNLLCMLSFLFALHISSYIKYWSIFTCYASQTQCSPAISTLGRASLTYDMDSESNVWTAPFTSSLHAANQASPGCVLFYMWLKNIHYLLSYFIKVHLSVVLPLQYLFMSYIPKLFEIPLQWRWLVIQ